MLIKNSKTRRYFPLRKISITIHHSRLYLEYKLPPARHVDFTKIPSVMALLAITPETATVYIVAAMTTRAIPGRVYTLVNPRFMAAVAS
jgi:hypothetical protein